MIYRWIRMIYRWIRMIYRWIRFSQMIKSFKGKGALEKLKSALKEILSQKSVSDQSQRADLGSPSGAAAPSVKSTEAASGGFPVAIGPPGIWDPPTGQWPLTISPWKPSYR